MELHGKVWLEKNGDVLFGRGRYLLLRGIQEYGSLAETARHLGMSYRAAWGRLRSSEDRLGVKLVERTPGPGRGQSLRLTPVSRELIRLFDDLEAEFDALLQRYAQTIACRLEGTDTPHAD